MLVDFVHENNVRGVDRRCYNNSFVHTRIKNKIDITKLQLVTIKQRVIKLSTSLCQQSMLNIFKVLLLLYIPLPVEQNRRKLISKKDSWTAPRLLGPF